MTRPIWINRTSILIALTLIIGVALRLVWPGDIEYKGDERYVFEAVRNTLSGKAPWPSLGMSSGVGIQNPGLSIWVFIVLGSIFGADSPVELARAVQWTNIFAMVGLLVFIFRCVPEEDRESWLWGAALVFLNPFEVLFQRKIWAPSVFPLLTVAMLSGWWFRQRALGAFVWGGIGALLGQVQMGGGFPLALAFVLGTLVAGRGRGVRWGYWLLGSLLGVLPMLNWLRYLWGVVQSGLPPSYHEFYQQLSSQTHPLSSWMDQIPGQFWWLWSTGAAGIGLDYSLHREVWAFLAWPELNGAPTYLAGVLSGIAALVLLLILLRTAREIFYRDKSSGVSLVQGLIGAKVVSNTTLALASSFFWFGFIFTVSPFFAHRHYLLVAFPFQGLWLARLALWNSDQQNVRTGRILLGIMCLALFGISLLFMIYIHANGGAPTGDFGVAYSSQGQG